MSSTVKEISIKGQGKCPLYDGNYGYAVSIGTRKQLKEAYLIDKKERTVVSIHLFDKSLQDGAIVHSIFGGPGLACKDLPTPFKGTLRYTILGEEEWKLRISHNTTNWSDSKDTMLDSLRDCLDGNGSLFNLSTISVDIDTQLIGSVRAELNNTRTRVYDSAKDLPNLFPAYEVYSIALNLDPNTGLIFHDSYMEWAFPFEIKYRRLSSLEDIHAHYDI